MKLRPTKISINHVETERNLSQNIANFNLRIEVVLAERQGNKRRSFILNLRRVQTKKENFTHVLFISIPKKTAQPCTIETTA